MKARKLSKREFARAIKFGLGRAVLHVRDYGDKGVEDILKEAMLHNYVFDMQFESDRCSWLYSILSLTGRLRSYVDFFYQTVCNTVPSEYDMRQQLVLAGIFFSLGFEEFRPIVLNFGSKLSACKRFKITGGCELFDVAGTFGFEMAVKGICRAETDLLALGYECNQIYEHSENGIREDIGKVLTRLEEQEPDLKRFRDSVTAFKADSDTVYEERPKLTLDEFLRGAEEQTDAYAFASSRFGRSASPEELDVVFALLLKETEWMKQYSYISVFRCYQLPKISEKIFKLLDSPHHRLRHACATALANSVDARVRAKALKMLRSREDFKIPLALTLLQKNYRPSDAPIILSALENMSDPIQIHSAGGDVKDLLSSGEGKELVDCFFWLYEHGPEAHCRYYFLESLIEWDICPKEIVYEAQWDSGEEVQALARDFLTRREMVEQDVEHKVTSELLRL